MPALRNIDRPTVEHFGAEWDKFDQRGLPRHELERLFEAYFSVFPWQQLPPSSEGFDVGCGSGRWAAFVAARVGRLHCIDASERALAIARRNLKSLANCDFYAASFDDLNRTAWTLAIASASCITFPTPKRHCVPAFPG